LILLGRGPVATSGGCGHVLLALQVAVGSVVIQGHAAGVLINLDVAVR